MKVRFTGYPWIVPNVGRIVWETRKKYGVPLVGFHCNDEAYVPVRWGNETVILIDMGEDVEVVIRSKEQV